MKPTKSELHAFFLGWEHGSNRDHSDPTNADLDRWLGDPTTGEVQSFLQGFNDARADCRHRLDIAIAQWANTAVEPHIDQDR